MAALAVIGVGAFFLTRDDDDGESLASLPTDATVPDVTVPDVTGPDVTIPDVTIPDVTIPVFTLPDITDFSIPDITLPDLGEIPPPGQEPVGLGNDPELDRLAQECYDGDMESCDDLYGQSEFGSEYEAYGDTCAGRQETDTNLLCVVAFPS